MTEAPTSPEVSVILPAHNAADFIAAQLSALLSQETDAPVELIVVDNRSTDCTSAEVGLFAESHANVFLVSAFAMAGAAYARNEGASKARGNLLLFCDADDLVCPTWITAHTKALANADISIGVVRNSTLPCDPDEFDRPFPTHVPKLGPYPRLASGNVGIRRSVFESLGGFDTALLTGEDAELGVRAWDAGLRISATPGARLLRGVSYGSRRRFTRSYQYGRGTRTICDKHASFPRPELKKDCWFIVSRSPTACLPGPRKDAWLTKLGSTIGYLRGGYEKKG